MKTSVLLLLLPCGTTAFQFMKGWKMPTVDPHQAEIEERFGDKSAFEFLTSFGSSLLVSLIELIFLTYFCLSCKSLHNQRTGRVDGNFLRFGTQDGTSLVANRRIPCDRGRARVSVEYMAASMFCHPNQPSTC